MILDGIIWDEMGLYGMIQCLVGGFNPSEKYEFVNWDDDIPNMMGREK